MKLIKRKMKIFCMLFVLVTGVMMAGTCSRMLPGAVAQAASSQKISFTDGSGRYLEKIGKNYYLRDKSGKKLTGIQYLKIKKVDKLSSGFYWFNDSGMLVQKKAVKYFNQVKVNGVTFHGFYYVNGNGRFITNAGGVIKISNLKCVNRTFDGYYYVDKYGKLSNKVQIRYLKAQTLGGMAYEAGYYYFDQYGKMNRMSCLLFVPEKTVGGRKFEAGYYLFSGKGKLLTQKAIYTLNTKISTVTLKGRYYFGGTNGRLLQKKGWTEYNGQKYYLDGWGRLYTNCWVDGYYLLSNGTIARSQKVPDGSYVDANGRKISQEQFEMGTLKRQIQSMINSYGGTWSVYVKNLETGSSININERSMHPASTIKLFVMASTYNQIAKGNLKETYYIQRLLRDMITVSDNDSYNQLVRLQTSSGGWTAGTRVINNFIYINGFTRTGCHSTLHPTSFDRATDGYTNVGSARDCGLLLERIYRGTCVNKTYSEKMLSLLLNQQTRWKIPAGVPYGVKVANKTGENSDSQHDAAIVYGPKTDYILCIYSNGCSEYTAGNGIKNISSKVYNYLN